MVIQWIWKLGMSSIVLPRFFSNPPEKVCRTIKNPCSRTYYLCGTRVVLVRVGYLCLAWIYVCVRIHTGRSTSTNYVYIYRARWPKALYENDYCRICLDAIWPARAPSIRIDRSLPASWTHEYRLIGTFRNFATIVPVLRFGWYSVLSAICRGAILPHDRYARSLYAQQCLFRKQNLPMT